MCSITSKLEIEIHVFFVYLISIKSRFARKRTWHFLKMGAKGSANNHFVEKNLLIPALYFIFLSA